ncbi:EAL domain-containing protein [Aurantimonas sp. Leaf443]|uniref:putative bifunctional diguanylate cyclase/phosphodiesterase n=1 Tax=Aurantimonas sp. Leaf443 TaxID=1736378 RepID=UPI0006FB8817|nr:EAL domain-containing protein [Aurantimonas sp. Leaf443]KQT82465.1 hypothetical protein ASG48_15435 [Aurantimonas sp. Leaf443]
MQDEDLFRAVVDRSPTATLVCDLDTYALTYANAKALDLLRAVETGQEVAEHGVGDAAPAFLRDCLLVRKAMLASPFAKRLKAEVAVGGEILSLEIEPLRRAGRPVEALVFAGITTDTVSTEAALWHMAHHDPLTDLPNRAYMNARLDALVADGLEGERCLAVLCLDLDRFKLVNDLLGHPVGDILLKQVADRLRSLVQEEDLVCRLGGDEFVVLQTSGTDAERLALSIIEALSRPYTLDGQQFEIGTSVGIALHPRDGATPTDLLKHADIALYTAKKTQRGTARFFEPKLVAGLTARVTLERDLAKALERQEMRLEYQPIYRCDGRTLDSFEALLRWDHPQRGPVAPAEFIPLAEETGLIHEIGAFALRTACAEAARWRQPYPVAVNFSPMQFRRKDLVRTIRRCLSDTGLDAGRLTLEVTEGLLIQNPQQSEKVLRELHALGIKLSLDDFGTGFSSLSYLLRYPFDQLKIDRSFITLIGDKDEATSVVQAILTLAASLKLRVVAEGVEHSGQLLQLAFLKCECVQGYYLGRPMPPGAVRSLIAAKPMEAVTFSKDWVRQAMSVRRPGPTQRKGTARVIPPPSGFPTKS